MSAVSRLTERELKLTAILYCMHGAHAHLKASGKLPDKIGGPWSVIPMRLLIEKRGTEPELTPAEQEMLEAIRREQRLPGGAIHLVRPE